MEYVHRWAAQYRKLAFGEAMLTTFARHASLKHTVAHEMRQVVYRKDWTEADVDCYSFLHPVKDFEKQEQWRQTCSTKQCPYSIE